MIIKLLSKVKDMPSVVNGLLCWLGLTMSTLVCFIIFFDSLEQLERGNFYFSSFCFALMFCFAIVSSGKIAPTIFIFFTPLLPSLNVQITAFSSLALPTLPMAGFDLVAGFFLGLLSKYLIYSFAVRNIDPIRALRVPWPINAVLLIITFSTILAILRNSWASASLISFNALTLSMISARGVSWFEDWRPLTDWMAYVMAGTTFLLTLNLLKFSGNRLAVIYRPLLAGLFLSGILALIQSKTGIGYENPPTYQDIFGYAPYGFQPDLHAYAGYTLLGAVGLWGYFFTAKMKFERVFILLVIAISWYGLIASISKSSIFLAFFVSMVGIGFWILRRNKKSFVSALLKVGLLTSVLVSLLLLAILADLVSTPNYLKYLYQAFSKLDWSNFNEISAAFSNRPGIWFAAFRMWEIVPIFGVGQGDFYQLSHLFNFYNISDLRVGENTHNYFLQTLAETGLFGAIAFLVAIAAPFFLVKDRRVLWPAAVALFSLFLGNIFAHSFLVRENLFLAAILLGLMYSYVPAERLALSPLQLLNEWKPKISWNWILPSAVFVVLVLGAREVYTSFYKFPFQYGSNCWINRPVGPDGWTSGLYEVPLPVGSHGLRLPLKVMRPNLGEKPLEASFSLIDSKGQVLTTQAIEWRENGPNTIEIVLPNGGVIQEAGVKASLKLSSCYTPRNLGESADGRRLGVMVDSPIIY